MEEEMGDRRAKEKDEEEKRKEVSERVGKRKRRRKEKRVQNDWKRFCSVLLGWLISQSY